MFELETKLLMTLLLNHSLSD